MSVFTLRSSTTTSSNNNDSIVCYRDFSGTLETNFMSFLSQEEMSVINDRRSTIFAAFQTTDTISSLDSSSSSSSFPIRLHTMLTSLEDIGLSCVCSWQIHGRSFLVHDRDKFEKFILPKFFRSIKMRSFQKQLSIYGFRRVLEFGHEDYGSHYHDLFLRGKPFLCQAMNTSKNKARKLISDSRTNVEPNFYAMPYLPATLPDRRHREMSINVFVDDKNIEKFVREVQEARPQQQQQYEDQEYTTKRIEERLTDQGPQLRPEEPLHLDTNKNTAARTNIHPFYQTLSTCSSTTKGEQCPTLSEPTTGDIASGMITPIPIKDMHSSVAYPINSNQMRMNYEEIAKEMASSDPYEEHEMHTSASPLQLIDNGQMSIDDEAFMHEIYQKLSNEIDN